ncbi:MAG: AAA family ATPase, partial [Bacteroidetes bacterium]
MSLKIYPSVRRDITPQEYILQPGLKNAVEVAIALRQPLLVTGEPGTGKTRLADKVAWMLAQQKGTHFLDKPLVFNTKTSSTSRDLFYTYDAMSHYQAANIKREEITRAPKTADFIELQAFGQAIAMTNPASVDTSKFKTPIGDKPVSSVVLIDEIDKAPRDFTNDILHEVDRYE